MTPLLFAFAILSGWMPEEGEPEQPLLKTIVRAHLANLDRYPHGEMKARFQSKQVGQPSFFSTTESHLWWNGDRIRSKTLTWRGIRKDVDTNSPYDDEFEWIISPTRIVVYHPRGKRVVISATAGGEPDFTAIMNPANAWFKPVNMSGFSWLPLVDPSRSPRGRGFVLKRTVSRLTEELVRLTITDERSKGVYELDHDLASEGNVVRYVIHEPSSSLKIEGRSHFRRIAKGYLMLAESHQSTVSVMNGRSITIDKTYETLSFDPDQTPSTAMFELQALNLPRGVMILDETTGRRKRVGDVSVTDVASQLPALIELMRKRGFAAKVRE
jgi:hypothetical protein